MSHRDALPSPEGNRLVGDECDKSLRFERALVAGAAPRLEDYLASSAPSSDLLESLLALELRWRRQRGETPAESEYHSRFPEFCAAVDRAFQRAALSAESVNAITSIEIPPFGPTPVRPELPSFATTHLPDAGPPPVEERPGWWPVLPEYEVLEEIGQGGMGVVYKARQRSLNRLVALKMVAGTAHTTAQLRRFKDEAQAIARLAHNGIVRIFDVGEYHGQPYFVLELIQGGTLRQRIVGPMDPREAVRILAAVARAIHFAHTNHVVHRDLKPGNILLTAEGEPKVADFGIAKLLDAGTDHTRTGAVLGTAEYMAPEQARGDIHAIGPPTDVYSLGVILFECLTARRPIEGQSQVETLQRVLLCEPELLRRWLPPTAGTGAVGDLEAICQKCLEKEPGRRYASAAALADDLERWLAGEAIRARPVGRVGRAWRWCRRNPLSAALAGLASAFVLTLMVATPALVLLYLDAERERERAEESRQEAQFERANAQEQEHLAREKERETSRRVARLSAATGARLIDAGDSYRALVWTTDALRREQQLAGDKPSPRVDVLRLRIAALLENSPRLVHQLHIADWADRIRVSEDGLYLIAVDSDRTRLGRWRLDNGNRADPALPPGTPHRRRFGEDGRYALDQAEDGSLHLWDVDAGRALCRLEALPTPTDGPLIFWTHDLQGKQLYAILGSRNRSTGGLWSVETGKCLAVQPNGPQRWDRRCSARLRSGRLLLWQGGEALLIDMASKEKATAVSTITGMPSLSTDGTLLAGPDGSRWPVVWDTGTGKAISWPGPSAHASPVTRLHFDSDGGQLLVLSEDSRCRVWKPRTGEPVCDWLTHGATVREGWFSPDDRYLLTVSDEGSARVWDLLTSQPVTPPLRHAAPVATAAWADHGRRVVTRARDGSVRVWDLVRLASPSRVLLHDGPVRSIRFNVAGDKVLTASDDGTARCWEVESGRPLGAPLRHAGPVIAAEWSADGTRAVTLSEKAARAWRVPEGKPLIPAVGAKLGNEVGVHLVRLHPRGGQVLLGYAERANLFDLELLRDRASIRHDDNHRLAHTAFSPDGTLIATADKQGEVRTWEPAGSREVRRFRPPAAVSELRFLSNRELAATGAFGLRRWDVLTGTESLRLPDGAAEEYRSAHLSADALWLVTVSLENTCRAWDVKAGRPLGPAFQPGGPLRLVAVTDEGRHAVTVLDEGEWRTWDTHTGEPLTPAFRLRNYVHDARLSPDGKLLALACRDGKARLWKLPVRNDHGEAVLEKLAHLLAAQLVDPGEALQNLDEKAVHSLHQVLPRALPDEFRAAAHEVIAWHGEQASDCENAGRWRAAVFHLDALLRLSPNRPDLVARRASACLALGQTSKAIDDLTTLIGRDPEAPSNHERRGRALVKLGRWEEARVDFEEAVRRDPDNGALWLRISLMKERTGDVTEARKAYRQALEHGIDLSYRPYFASDFRRDPQDSYERRRQWQPLVDDLHELLGKSQNPAPDRAWAATLRRHCGLALAVVGDWQQAAEHFRDAGEPGHVETLRGLALSAWMTGKKRDVAESHVKAALALDEKDGSLWLLQALLLLEDASRSAEALASLDRAVACGAEPKASRLARAGLLHAQGRLREALADLNVVIDKQQGKHVPTLCERAALHVELGQWQRAADDYLRAADLPPVKEEVVRPALLLGEKSKRGSEWQEQRQTLLTRLLRQPPRTLENDDRLLARVIRTALLFPGEPAELSTWLDFLAKVADKQLAPAEHVGIRGAVALRRGDIPEAVRLLDRAIAADPDGGSARDWYFLAIARRIQKDPAASAKAIDCARDWSRRREARQLKHEVNGEDVTWIERLEWEHLEREARTP